MGPQVPVVSYLGDQAVCPSCARKHEKRTMKMKEPMTKLQKEVTDWMKQSIPTKKTKFLHSHLVTYFIGSKAVDMLMTESPWAKGSENTDLVFDSRDKCVEFLDT